MPIPKYDEMMLPVLRMLADGAEHPQSELAEGIAAHFQLTPEERSEMLPKVRATYLRHRLGWAGFSLRRAGLAENPRSGTLRITEDGKEFLASNPTQLRAADLKNFPSYAAFLARTKTDIDATHVKASDASASLRDTPEEKIQAAFTELNESLITD